MDCSEAKACVEPFLKGNLRPVKIRAFLKHIKTCPACYEELETGCLVMMTDKRFQDSPEGYDLKKMMETVIEKQKKRWHRAVAATGLGLLLLLGLITVLILYLNGLL